MEFSKQQIARLVLGYLKAESCYGAYNEFLQSSLHLKKHVGSKYVITRVNGLTLVDYLTEYAMIYTLVQERLEASNYYNENNSYTGLVDQLLYLLENGHYSRSQTPFSSTKNATSNNRYSSDFTETTDISKISEQNDNHLYGTATHQKISSDINTSNKNKRTEILSALKCNRSADRDETYCKKPHENIPLEVLTQTLLENHELHEKIAENINYVRNTPPEAIASTSIVPEDKFTQELETTIKTVIEKTESEPVFEKLLNEIIGFDLHSTSDQTDSHEDEGTVCSTDGITLSRTVLNTECKKRRPRKLYSKDCVASQPTCNTIQQQNTISTSTGDVILYGGSIDNYMKTNIPVSKTTNNSCYTNSNNLLMVNAGTSVYPNNIVNNPVQPSVAKPYYFVTGNSVTNGNPVLSEQDILNMPTVIVCEENQPTSSTPQPFIITPYGNRLTNQVVNIVPTLNTATTARSNDYVTLFHCSDSEDSMLKNAVSENGETSHVKKCNVGSNSEKKEESKEPATVQHDREVKSDSTKSLPHLITPNITESTLGDKHSTPNSGSHIRALNFATPDKFSIQTKTSSLPKAESLDNKAVQMQAVKKGLFQTPKVVKTGENQKKTVDKCEPQAKMKNPGMGSWDANLRALIAHDANVKCDLTKRKDTTVPRKKKKKTASSKVSLNTTEVDGKLIEEALNANLDIKDKDISAEVKSKYVEEDSSIITDNKKENLDVAQENVVENVTETVHNLEQITINCNNKPRFKKKCNITEPAKQEVSVTKVKEIKEINFINDLSILSQSTLKNSVQPTVLSSSENQLCSEKTILEDSKVIQINPSDVLKNNAETFHHDPKNEMPFLETPIKPSQKSDFMPKTPGYFSPVNNTDTPFTRVLKEHLEGVDLSTIPTPQFPITPNIPFTPGFENRPTDYSTSSSYYQPSDTEHSKSLEKQTIKECIDQETKLKIESNASVKRKVNIIDDIKIPVVQVNEPMVKTVAENFADPAVAQKLLSLSKNVIARKDLNLVKPDESESSCDSSSEESSDESSEDSDSSNYSSNMSECSMVDKKQSPENVSSRYSLRSRAVTSVNSGKENPIKNSKSTENSKPTENTKPIENVQPTENAKPTESFKLNDSLKLTDGLKLSENLKLTEDLKLTDNADLAGNSKPVEKLNPCENITLKKDTPLKSHNEVVKRSNANSTINKNEVLSYKQKVLNEMEIKRKRMIEKINNDTARGTSKNSNKKSNLTGKKVPDRMTNGRFTKSKSLVKSKGELIKESISLEIFAINNPKPSTSKAKKNNNGVKHDEKTAVALDKDEPAGFNDIMLHLSSDDEQLEPFEVVETNLLELSNSNPTSEKINDQVYDISVQSFKKALECAKNKSVDSKNGDENAEKVTKTETGTSGEDAENLIRDLKERGIHLVPNKSFEKTNDKSKVAFSNFHKDSNKVSDGGVGNKNVKCDTINNAIDLKTVCEKKSDKNMPSTSEKDNDATLLWKKLFGDTKSETKVNESEIIKELISKETLRISDPKNDTIEKAEPKSIEAVKSDIHIKNITKVASPKPDVIKESIDFDIKTYEEETLKIIHDESKKCEKTMKDYDLKLLKKKLNANVYMEELDREVERPISVTSFEFLLELPTKIPKQKTRSLVSKDGKQKSISPLCDLYESMKSGKYKKDLNKKVKRQELQCSNKKESKNESKSNRTSKTSGKIKDVINTLRANKKESLHRTASKKDLKTNRSNTSKNKVSDRAPEQRTQDLHIDVKKVCSESDPSISQPSCSKPLQIESKSRSSAKENSKCTSEITKTDSKVPETGDANDFLMNYAIIGSKKEEGSNVTKCDKSTKKRKASGECEKSEKKCKTNDCQELIKKVGVDILLKKLHGEK